MDDLIHSLETKIKQFLNRFTQLDSNNKQLIQEQLRLEKANESMMQKQKFTVLQIQKMISSLKSVENTHDS